MKNLTKQYKSINLNIIDIVSSLLNELNDREKDVLVRRFALHGKKKETLEKVGGKHGLTRERIRQIENSSIKKLSKVNKSEKEIEDLQGIITSLLEEHGGFMEREYLLSSLLHISLKHEDNENSADVHKSHFEFLISKLLNKHIDEVSNHSNFNNFYKLKEAEVEHLEEILEELHNTVSQNKIVKTNDLISLFLDLESYKKHEDKINREYHLDISDIFVSELFKEDNEVINKNKVLYSMLLASKKIDQNKFGHWGRHDSREIKPKTINDKIYLVLGNLGSPMHFVEIAERINGIGFDKKKSNSATVHNELILDPKYVLVGRGQYALKEWGYKEGTVLDVIKELLADNESLSRDEIIDKVLENRVVKKTTIILSLMNKDHFDKVDGKYLLK